MIKQLVVNGCSYMHTYASGQGHVDLAKRLQLVHGQTIAVSGSANSRIIRTTLKHSYQTQVPTLYVLGMTFVSRLELPICEPVTEFEGRWTNPQNQEYANRWQHGWSNSDVEKFLELKLKSEVFSILDRTEDLMYRMVSLIHDLKCRGHRVLLFQQADNLYQTFLNDSRFDLLKRDEIIDGFAWRAAAWQSQQGVRTITQDSKYQVPADMRHPDLGAHDKLNTFLTNYIKQYKILE